MKAKVRSYILESAKYGSMELDQVSTVHSRTVNIVFDEDIYISSTESDFQTKLNSILDKYVYTRLTAEILSKMEHDINNLLQEMLACGYVVDVNFKRDDVVRLKKTMYFDQY